MRFRHIFALSAALASMAVVTAGSAAAEESQAFVEHQHHHIEQLLHEPDSPSRESQVHESLSSFVDYDELTHGPSARRAPCPSRRATTCWSKYDDGQRTELRSLLEQLVRKTYQRNLLKTLDYDVTYRGSRDAAGDTRVLTEAKNKLKPREPAVRVDYVVKQTAAAPRWSTSSPRARA